MRGPLTFLQFCLLFLRALGEFAVILFSQKFHTLVSVTQNHEFVEINACDKLYPLSLMLASKRERVFVNSDLGICDMVPYIPKYVMIDDTAATLCLMHPAQSQLVKEHPTGSNADFRWRVHPRLHMGGEMLPELEPNFANLA